MAGSDRSAYVWQSLAPRLLHPLKVAIIEAMLWVDEPISSSNLARMMDSDLLFRCPDDA